MRLRILSDLHLEFHRDGGESFIGCQSDKDWDVLVLAGDITTSFHFADVLGWFRRAAGDRPIVYVVGNHEYYGSSVRQVQKALGALRDPKLFVLDNKVALIDGQRFIGSTLWFPHSGLVEPLDQSLSDFSQIEGLREWVGKQATKSARFLDTHIEEGDVVVTHHLPHRRSIHAQFEQSTLNGYFLHNVGGLVENGGAKVWVHGHTHCSCDYEAGTTRVICNPFGYLREGENRHFQEHLTIRV